VSAQRPKRECTRRMLAREKARVNSRRGKTRQETTHYRASPIRRKEGGTGSSQYLNEKKWTDARGKIGKREGGGEE